MTNDYTGLELYRGPSLLDGEPIVVLLTLHSRNRKTGDMAQTSILRADMPPVAAIKRHADASICGQCASRHALGGDCYVLPFQGPSSIWYAWHRGRYPVATARHLNRLRGRAIRFGTYGDPAAAPTAVWARLARLASLTTGYTHQPAALAEQGRLELLEYCMVSVDNEAEALFYQRRGARTYRVKQAHEPLLEDEIRCPYKAQGDLQCIDCGLCHGAYRHGKSIAIDVHGSRARGRERPVALIASDQQPRRHA